MSNLIQRGRFNVLLGGQWGSEGKGCVASHVGKYYDIDIVATDTGANAGHTFYLGAIKHHTTHIPVASVVNPNTSIYFTAGAIINVDTLFEEMERFNIDRRRIHIHPRASVITTNNILAEKSMLPYIGSTKSGTGHALSDKVLRLGKIADDDNKLTQFINQIDLNKTMVKGNTIFMETGQGLELSLTRPSYPFCTSRDITVNQVLSDAQVHSHRLGKVNICMRTYPIRSGNVYDQEGKLIETTGDVWYDQNELTWEELDIDPEIATVTGRKRRIFDFSYSQFLSMIETLNPDNVILTFFNYLPEDKQQGFIDRLNSVSKYLIRSKLTPNYEGVKYTSSGPGPDDVKLHR